MDTMTIREFAAIMKLGSRCIYRLVRMGELPAIRIGRTLRIRKSDAAAFVGSRRIIPKFPSADATKKSETTESSDHFEVVVPLAPGDQDAAG